MDETTESTKREYLTPPEVGEILGVGHNKILDWVHAGELRAVDLSTSRGKRPRWRISRHDLESFLARRSATPPPTTRRQRQPSQRVTQFY